LRWLAARFQKSINLVSLFLGKLRVIHREACLWLSAPSTLVRGKSLIYTSAYLSTTSFVALMSGIQYVKFPPILVIFSS
jgi:hypothetical protein